MSAHGVSVAVPIQVVIGRWRALLAGSGAALVALAMVPGTANALDAVRYDQRGASGVCAPSLPVHAAGLRARPLGLANEGSTEVFVTCTFVGAEADGRVTDRISVRVGNFGAGSRTMTCTLVDGFATGSSTAATYSPKSVQVFAGIEGPFIEWVNPENVQRAAVQCRLPPGTAVQYIGTRYWESVGN